MSFVTRYLAEEKMENAPQTPFMIVTRSARWKFLFQAHSCQQGSQTSSGEGRVDKPDEGEVAVGVVVLP